MSEKVEADLTSGTKPDSASTQDSPKESAGDILRKERIARRITIETIAKDLKLNIKYIKALENNETGFLPADPYVRVYLRSLAKYLTLDPDEILRKFYEERGLGVDPFKKDVVKIEIEVKEKEYGNKNTMLLVAIVILIILGGFMMFANKKGWISTGPSSIVNLPDSTSDTAKTMTAKALQDSILDDSLYSGAPVQPSDSSRADSTSQKATAATTDTGSVRLKVTITKDSSWMQIFTDGKSTWKKTLYQGQSHEFSAKDSLNCNIGNNAVVKYIINGKSFRIRGPGQTIFKVDRKGHSTMTLTQWTTVFKGRLE